ncbi:MAG TPA: CPBP family intramembrane glutamic endopeptidase [Steroidobacteraceae bacterium]|nr:CPBP family intramembrane glutamic endopeptidase [Steroidobacteraceae bacterium]
MRAFAVFLALLAAALAVVALCTYPAWLLLHPHFDFPFHRIGERLGMLALAAGFILVARRLGLADRASLGFGLPRPLFVRELLVGLALGVATMLMIVAAMSALGLLDWSQAAGLAAGGLARLLLARLASALAVAFIEESFLRGAMYSAIERESGARAAVLLTALLYAATHFFGKVRIAPQDVTAWSGVALLGQSLDAFAHFGGIVDAFLALFGVGVVLALIRQASGNIAGCLGLHAGWVWVMLVAHELTTPRRDVPLAFLLSRFDGFVGWLVLAATAVFAVPLWRFYAARAIRIGKKAAAGTP